MRLRSPLHAEGESHAQVRLDVPGLYGWLTDVCEGQFGVLVAEVLPMPATPRRVRWSAWPDVPRARARGSTRVRSVGDAPDDGNARDGLGLEDARAGACSR
jgi:hypothetical protein